MAETFTRRDVCLSATANSVGGASLNPRLSVARPMDVPAELEALGRFHGHLGVYVTLGLRMGDIARRALGPYKGLTARVTCSPSPPMLCVVDGIQFSSGCTVGKGNLSLEPGDEPAVRFAKGTRRLRIELRPGWRERIDGEMSKERELEQSLFYWTLPADELFTVREEEADES